MNWMPTGELRVVRKWRVTWKLQQQWIDTAEGVRVWRDIDVVEVSAEEFELTEGPNGQTRAQALPPKQLQRSSVPWIIAKAMEVPGVIDASVEECGPHRIIISVKAEDHIVRPAELVLQALEQKFMGQLPMSMRAEFRIVEEPAE